MFGNKIPKMLFSNLGNSCQDRLKILSSVFLTITLKESNKSILTSSSLTSLYPKIRLAVWKCIILKVI